MSKSKFHEVVIEADFTGISDKNKIYIDGKMLHGVRSI